VRGRGKLGSFVINGLGKTFWARIRPMDNIKRDQTSKYGKQRNTTVDQMKALFMVIAASLSLVNVEAARADWLFTSQLGKQVLYDDAGKPKGIFSTLPPETNRSVQSRDGTIYVSNPSENQIVAFNADGTAPRVFASVETPIGLAIDVDKRLYVTSNGNSILRYFLDGRHDPSFSVYGICGAHDIVAHKGLLYVSSQCGKIFTYSEDGILLNEFTPGLQNLVGLAIDDSGIMYFTSYDEYPIGTGAVGRMNTDGTGFSVIASGLFRPHGIKIGPDGKLYVVQLYKDNVLRFNLDGSAAEVFIAHIDNPLGISYLTPPASSSTITARAEFRVGPKIHDDSYWVQGFLKLDDTSDGIDPITEAVTIHVGAFSHTLPAGSFVRDGAAYTFKGSVGPSMLDVRITPSSTPGGYSFKSCLKNGSLGATTMGPQVQLTIGNDSGKATLDVGYAKFGKAKEGQNGAFPPGK